MDQRQGLTIHAARTSRDLDAVRALLRSYAAYLAANPTGAANICITDYEAELATLPGSYSSPQGTIFLARIEDQPAGCVAFRPTLRTQPSEEACEMKRLWVDPAFRGHHLGKRLVEEGIDWARTRRYTEMYLDTVPAAMPHANSLYQTLGFRAAPRYNDNPVAEVVFFRLELT